MAIIACVLVDMVLMLRKKLEVRGRGSLGFWVQGGTVRGMIQHYDLHVVDAVHVQFKTRATQVKLMARTPISPKPHVSLHIPIWGVRNLGSLLAALTRIAVYHSISGSDRAAKMWKSPYTYSHKHTSLTNDLKPRNLLTLPHIKDPCIIWGEGCLIKVIRLREPSTPTRTSKIAKSRHPALNPELQTRNPKYPNPK